MNRSTIEAVRAATAALGLILCSAACGDAGDTLAPRAGLVSSELVARRTPTPSVTTCERDHDGTLTTSADRCSGAGRARILVRLDGQATCASVANAVLASIPGTRAATQFAGAPQEIQDRFCVFEAADATSLPAIESALCGRASVELATHDCSTDPLVASASQPGAFVAPQGDVSDGDSAAAPSFVQGYATSVTDTSSPHPCDACGAVKKNTLFVTVPPAMVATSSDAVMVARFADRTLPDVEVRPPAGAQSFLVPNVGAPDDMAVDVYPPGTVPPAR